MISYSFYLFPLLSSQKTKQESIEKVFAASLIGSGLCFVNQGKYSREDFVLLLLNLFHNLKNFKKYIYPIKKESKLTQEII